MPKKTQRRMLQVAGTEAYFRRLSIANVRCFGPEPQVLELGASGYGPSWTLILGQNGTGKTTLLWSLAGFSLARVRMGRSLSSEKILPRAFLPKHRDVWKRFRRANADRPVIKAELESLTAPQDSSTIELAHDGDLPQMSRRLHPSGDSFVNVVVNAYGAWRKLDLASKLTESELDRADPTDNLFDQDSGLIDPVEWLTRLDYSSRFRSKIAKVQRFRLEQVIDVLTRVLPEVEAIRFGAPTYRNIIPIPHFKTPYGWVPLRGLSNGYQTMISWVVDFAARLFYRYPDSPDPLAEPAVCLVDEIDLHLHPRWQREIMTFLSERFPKTQFIATAHSPLIVQAAETVNANVAVLRREGDHVVIENHPESVRGWRVDQILASDLFGGVGPWPPMVQEKMTKRLQLLSQPTLSKSDKQQLAALDSDLKDLPVGETPAQIEINKLLQRSLELSQQREASGS